MLVGSVVALVTPMYPNGDVDWQALQQLVDFHIENESKGIVAVGTTGESPTLPEKEHMEVIAQVVDRAAGRIPVIAGTGANSTAEAIAWTQQAKSLGADYALLVTPYYNKPGQEGLYRHFMAIADKVEIPQILYNVPARTACDLLPGTVERLKTHSNIVGIKEASGDLSRCQEVIDRCGDQISVYSGDDATAMELLLMGGKGVISVTANVVPKLMSELCEYALAGDQENAARINEKIDALNKDLFLEANPIPVKWVLAEMGMIKQGIRLPLTWLDEKHHERVRHAMLQAGIE